MWSLPFVLLNPKPPVNPSIPIPSPSTTTAAAPHHRRRPSAIAVAAAADPNPATPSDSNPNPKPKSRRPKLKPQPPKPPQNAPQTTIPRKPRRGRRSEAAAVEDFVRDRLERTFEAIRQQGGVVLDGKEAFLKERKELEEREGSGSESEEEEEREAEVVEEEDPNWPIDADVGWGIRASEYFEKHSIRNVVEEGVEIDWEGEMEQGWVKEINCLEWESFAFHPSPIIVLVFERYKRYIARSI